MIHSINDLQADNDVLAEEMTAAMQKFYEATHAKDTEDRIYTDVVISVRTYDVDDPEGEPLVVEKIEGVRLNLGTFGFSLSLGSSVEPALFEHDTDFNLDFIQLKG